MEKPKTCFALKDVLPAVIERISVGKRDDHVRFESAWHAVVGREPVGLSYAGFKDGCVFVTVDSPARLYQWKLKRAATLRLLCERCPEVKNIAFKIGKVK